MGDAPQNTLPAFSAALAAGAAGLESDVWLTADGLPVLDHDGIVDEQKIAEYGRSELPRHIPTLTELYDECGTNFQLSLDILDPRSIPGVVRIARQYGAAESLWIVGEWPTIRTGRSVGSDVHVVANVLWWRLGPGFGGLLRDARAAGICAINMPFWLWNPVVVGRVHHAGMLAFGWRANERWQIDWLRKCGCDGIYSDSVAPLVALTR